MSDQKDVKVEVKDTVGWEPRIMASTWCVECRKGNSATRIYHGDGLCEAHFTEKVGRT